MNLFRKELVGFILTRNILILNGTYQLGAGSLGIQSEYWLKDKSKDKAPVRLQLKYIFKLLMSFHKKTYHFKRRNKSEVSKGPTFLH